MYTLFGIQILNNTVITFKNTAFKYVYIRLGFRGGNTGGFREKYIFSKKRLRFVYKIWYVLLNLNNILNILLHNTDKWFANVLLIKFELQRQDTQRLV